MIGIINLRHKEEFSGIIVTLLPIKLMRKETKRISFFIKITNSTELLIYFSQPA